MMKNAVTITIIFKGSALNRDEKAGGNILTIKKLKRGDGKVYPYISRPAIRHYLFTTLWRKNPERWKIAEVRLAQNDVIQFDLNKGNAVTRAELDLFGYMATMSGSTAITRKAPLGITKAEGLEPWEGDMAFYSNHDLVRRGREKGLNAQPDLYNKEEYLGFFKVSFTLDLERIGKVDELKNYELRKEKGIEIIIPGETVKITPEKGRKVEKIEEGKEYKGKIGNTNVTFKVEKNEFYIKLNSPKIENNELKLKSGQKEYSLPVKRQEENGWVILFLPDPQNAVEIKKDEGTEKWFINFGSKIKISLSEIEESESVLESGKIKLVLKKSKKICRIQDVLEAIRGGLIYHSSTENYGITPLFLAAAIVKVSVPVLHNYVVVKKIERDRFEIDKNAFKKVEINPWVEKLYVESVFDENIPGISEAKKEQNWEDFLRSLLGGECEEKSSEVTETRKADRNRPKQTSGSEKGRIPIGTKAEFELKDDSIRIYYKEELIFEGTLEEAKQLTEGKLKEMIKDKFPEKARVKSETLSKILETIKKLHE